MKTKHTKVNRSEEKHDKAKRSEVIGWQDFVELCIASWLVISPFALGFFEFAPASVTAMLIGSVAIMFSLLGMATQRTGDEWGNLGAAILLIASPWLFSYSHIVLATMNAVVCGAGLILFAWLAMMADKAEMKLQKAEVTEK